MTTTAVPRQYATSLPVPTIAREFFDTLREFGTIKGINTGGVTLYLPGGDSTGEGSLGARILRLGQALGAKGIAPAFPVSGTTGPWGPPPSYRWEFDDAVYAGDDQWSIVVPVTADLLHLLDTVSGLAGYDRDYKGEPVLPVTYYPEDPADIRGTVSMMCDDLRTMEDDLHAWFGETVRFEDPQPVT